MVDDLTPKALNKLSAEEFLKLPDKKDEERVREAL
jgi:hypothetical protein